MKKYPYKIIDPRDEARYPTYRYFSTFKNPCYCFNVKMDVTEVVRISKSTNTSFFINILYLTTMGLNEIKEMRRRIVNGEIREYEDIDPNYTVMTKLDAFDNCGHLNSKDYKTFYSRAKSAIDTIKNEDKIQEGYNDEDDGYTDYYMSSIPWISLEGLTQPEPNDDPSSSSVPRPCWDKYREENGRYVMMMNITVSHALVDGKHLSDAFISIQKKYDAAESLLQ